MIVSREEIQEQPKATLIIKAILCHLAIFKKLASILQWEKTLFSILNFIFFCNVVLDFIFSAIKH